MSLLTCSRVIYLTLCLQLHDVTLAEGHAMDGSQSDSWLTPFGCGNHLQQGHRASWIWMIACCIVCSPNARGQGARKRQDRMRRNKQASAWCAPGTRTFQCFFPAIRGRSGKTNRHPACFDQPHKALYPRNWVLQLEGTNARTPKKIHQV